MPKKWAKDLPYLSDESETCRRKTTKNTLWEKATNMDAALDQDDHVVDDVDSVAGKWLSKGSQVV